MTRETHVGADTRGGDVNETFSRGDSCFLHRRSPECLVTREQGRICHFLELCLTSWAASTAYPSLTQQAKSSKDLATKTDPSVFYMVEVRFGQERGRL